MATGFSRVLGRVAVRAAVRVGVPVAAAAAVLLGGAGSAEAHAQLDTSAPADGIRLEVAPSRFELNLTERVELRYTRVTITDGAGRVTRLGPLRLQDRPTAGSTLLITRPGEPANTPTTLVADLPALAPDLYRVAWSTISSDDLHATSGVLVFGVQRDVAARTVPADPVPPAGEVLVRWAGLLGAALAAGAGLLLGLLGRAGLGADLLAGVRRRLLLGAAVGGGLALLGGLAVLALQLVDLGAAGSDAGTGAAWRVLASGDYGWRWLLRETAAAVLFALPLLALRGGPRPFPRRRTGASRQLEGWAGRVGAGAVLVYGVATGLTGHSGAAASRHPGRVLAEGLHVSAASLWAGVLVATVLVLVPAGRRLPGRDLLRPVLARFGLVAAGCLTVMTVTGLVLAGVRVATVDALLYSSYGRTLLVKLVLVLGVLLAGAVNAVVLHPRLAPRGWRPRLDAVRPVPMLLVEAVLAVGVVGAAAGLAATQPADGRGWSASTFAQPLATGRAEDLVETLQVAPNRPGRNFVTVDVFNTRRPEPGPITGVTVSVRGSEGAVVTVPLQPQGDGRWLLATDALTSSGRWDLAVSVARGGLPATTATYPWSVSEPTARLRRTVVSSAPLAPVLDRVAAGLALLALLGGAGAVLRRRRSRVSVVVPVAEGDRLPEAGMATSGSARSV